MSHLSDRYSVLRAVQQAADLAFATVRLGQTSFPELAAGMGKVIPLASTLGLEQEQLWGAMATLTGVTGSTAEVVTQMKATMQAFLSPSKNMQAALKNMGYESGQALLESKGLQGSLDALKDAVGGNELAFAGLFSSVEAQTAVLAMAGNQAENLTSKTAEMYEATGAANTAFERQTNTLAYDIQMVKNLGANFLTQLGTNILPYVREFAEAALPVVSEALEKIGSYMTGTIIPAAETAVKWISEHRTLILALAALLCGENLLLAGGKATGKNVLAENLAAAFGRPAWDISFHVNMDAASLIGMDTFAGGQVVFRPGPVYRCAQCGGFGVLDEINMAKNEALAVLHAVLDFRRAIDVPGYDRIPLAEETRFIATMNYGYAGTRELNEALTSRFVVIQMPTITQDDLEKLLRTQFPDLASKYVRQFALLFLDLQKKCDSAEISTKALDLRGMLDALRLIRRGIPAGAALDMGITNKAFDSYEQGLIRDVIAARIPAKLDAGKLFA